MDIQLSLRRLVTTEHQNKILDDEGYTPLFQASIKGWNYNSYRNLPLNFVSLSLFDQSTDTLHIDRIAGSYCEAYDEITTIVFGMNFYTLIDYIKVLMVIVTDPSFLIDKEKYIKELLVLEKAIVFTDTPHIYVPDLSIESLCITNNDDELIHTIAYFAQLFINIQDYQILKSSLQYIYGLGYMDFQNTAYNSNKIYKSFIDDSENHGQLQIHIASRNNEAFVSSYLRRFKEIIDVHKDSNTGFNKTLEEYRTSFFNKTDNMKYLKRNSPIYSLKCVSINTRDKNNVIDATNTTAEYVNDLIDQYSGYCKHLLRKSIPNVSVRVAATKDEYILKRAKLSRLCKDKGTSLRISNNVNSISGESPVKVSISIKGDLGAENLLRTFHYIVGITGDTTTITTLEKSYGMPDRRTEYLKILNARNGVSFFEYLPPRDFGVSKSNIGKYFYNHGNNYFKFMHSKIIDFIRDHPDIDETYMYGLLENNILGNKVSLTIPVYDFSKLSVLKLKGVKIKNIVVRPCDIDSAIEFLSNT